MPTSTLTIACRLGQHDRCTGKILLPSDDPATPFTEFPCGCPHHEPAPAPIPAP